MMNLKITKQNKRKFLVIIGFFFLLIIIGWLLCINFDRMHFKNEYPLVDSSREFIDQADFIINIVPLRNYLETLVHNSSDFDISLYLEFINTGANISINSNIRIWPASLAKLPLAIAIMGKVENDGDNLSIDSELEIKEQDRDSRSGSLAEKKDITKLSVDELIRYLLVESDNTAQHVLLANVSLNDMQTLVDILGLEELFNGEGKMSAREYTRLYRSLYYSALLRPEDSEKILELLIDSEFKDFLSGGLPQDVRFAHKYGEDLDHQIFLDSGIVYLPNRPFMMTVMIQAKDQSQPNSRERAVNIMHQISNAAYEYFDNK